MSKKTDLSPAARDLLKAVKKHYLKSREFNGLHLRFDRSSSEEIRAAVDLVKAGLVQVVGPADYMNIHIRPWPSRRTPAMQIEELRNLSADDYGVALYPMAKAMKGVKLLVSYDDAPFSRAMARGRSTLEIAFFSPDVLEGYRNDARFRFGMSDFGINFWLTDEAHEQHDHLDKDTVSLIHLGFAYDMSKYDPKDPESVILRRVAAFYGDLDDLTPEHQQRWATRSTRRASTRTLSGSPRRWALGPTALAPSSGSHRSWRTSGTCSRTYGEKGCSRLTKRLMASVGSSAPTNGNGITSSTRSTSFSRTTSTVPRSTKRES